MYYAHAAGIFLAVASAAFFLTPFFISLAHRTKMLDYPKERKAHAHPMPYLGGCVLFLTFWTGFILIYLQLGSISREPADLLRMKLSGIFLGSSIVFLMGLLDDRLNLSPFVKFLWQSTAAVILILFGLTVNLAQQLGPLGYVITFVWIVLIMNAFNFIDSIDGHCAGIAFISCLIFFSLSLILHQPLRGLFALCLGGALLGFLPFNLKPARIFLGDNGSLFLGYMMAAMTLLFSYSTPQYSTVTPFIPIFMFGVPIYDTVSVIIVRLYRGIAPWTGDRNHFAHRLVRIGMSEKVAAAVSHFIAFTLGLVAILSTQVNTSLGKIVLVLLFVSVIGIIALLEYYATMRIRLIEMLAATQKRRKDDIKAPENRRS